MYYPKSQIKSNLYTNGGEYILSTTKEEYKGYYYEISNGNKYTGKTPQDGPNIYLTSITSTLYNNAPPIDNNNIPDSNIYTVGEPHSTTLPTRSLPLYNPTLPTDQDKSLGVFSRYFCKKTNELIYLEINKQTYTNLISKSSTIAWDLYIPLTTLWYIKGNKEKTYKANKGLITLIEQRQQWYGFSQYLKEDFLKYYVGE